MFLLWNSEEIDYGTVVEGLLCKLDVKILNASEPDSEHDKLIDIEAALKT